MMRKKTSILFLQKINIVFAKYKAPCIDLLRRGNIKNAP